MRLLTPPSLQMARRRQAIFCAPLRCCKVNFFCRNTILGRKRQMARPFRDLIVLYIRKPCARVCA